METYKYNYNNYNYPPVQIPKNYPEYENSINDYKLQYFSYENNTYDNNYPTYQMKSFYTNQNPLNNNSNIYNIQTTNITNINYEPENNYINSEPNIIEAPKYINYNNANKKLVDNTKGKQNVVFINLLRQNNSRTNKINTLENQEKLPKDNFKTISDEVILKLNDITKNNTAIDLKGDEKNNNEKINYLKTSKNRIYEYNRLKYKKSNIASKIKLMKKNNNFITINDDVNSKKMQNSLNPKETKFKNFNKSTNNLTKLQKSKVFLNNNFSTNKIRDKLDSNFATIISQKKLKIFSSSKLIHTQFPRNSNNEIKKNKPEKIQSIKKPPITMKIINIKNSFKRLNTHKLISPLRKISYKKLINVKQSPNNENKIKARTNTHRNKIAKININSKVNTSIYTKTKLSSKNYNQYNTINSEAYLKNRDSISKEKKLNFSSNKIKKNSPNERSALKNDEKIGANETIQNFIQRANKFKNNSLKLLKKKNNTKINTKTNITEKNEEANKSKIRKKINKSTKEKSYLNNSRKINDEESRIFLNETAAILSNRKNFNSIGKDHFNKTGKFINQKKNIFIFKKKIHRKNSSLSFNKIPSERIYKNNKSFKGFSSEKKLKTIKKKYKFTQHNKKSKIIIKERNKEYLSEFTGFNNFFNSVNLNKSEEVKYNLNLTESYPKNEIYMKIEEYYNNNDSINNNKDNIKVEEKKENREENEDENKEEGEENILNHKSFILDLNNTIPINEKQLKDAFNNQSIIKSNNNVKSRPKIGNIN